MATADLLIARFADRIEVGDCWLWTGSKQKNGYPHRVHVDGVKAYPYRHFYSTLVGPIPIDYEIDHLCRVRTCVNPDHLEAVPHAVNMSRGGKGNGQNMRAKTHCPKGHPYEGDNLLITKEANGSPSRTCRACRKVVWTRANNARSEQKRLARNQSIA